jgi:hypothetical protein
VDVEAEFAAVRALAEPAVRLGHTRFEDGTEVYGYWPAKPGESALDAEYRVAWLRHIFFPALAPDELATLEQLVGRPLPDALSAWLTRCSNGLSVFSGEVDVYGLQRKIDRAALAPHVFNLAVERIGKTPRGASKHVFVFGSWGDAEPLYIDERDGTVHASSSDDPAPIRSWNSIGAMLLAEMQRAIAWFDHEGRRI